MKFYSWDEFDEDINELALDLISFAGKKIYGIKRGGLVVAIALSHRLNCKLVRTPSKADLIVDDIVDTGYSYKKYKKYNKPFLALHSKENLAGIKPEIFRHSVKIDEWVVYPWENKKRIEEDFKDFLRRRK